MHWRRRQPRQGRRCCRRRRRTRCQLLTLCLRCRACARMVTAGTLNQLGKHVRRAAHLERHGSRLVHGQSLRIEHAPCRSAVAASWVPPRRGTVQPAPPSLAKPRGQRRICQVPTSVTYPRCFQGALTAPHYAKYLDEASSAAETGWRYTQSTRYKAGCGSARAVCPSSSSSSTHSSPAPHTTGLLLRQGLRPVPRSSHACFRTEHIEHVFWE